MAQSAPHEAVLDGGAQKCVLNLSWYVSEYASHNLPQMWQRPVAASDLPMAVAVMPRICRNLSQRVSPGHRDDPVVMPNDIAKPERHRQPEKRHAISSRSMSTLDQLAEKPTFNQAGYLKNSYMRPRRSRLRPKSPGFQSLGR